MNIVPTKGFKEDKIFLSSNNNGNNSGGEEKLDNPLEMPSTTGHIASKSMVIESVKIKNGRWTKDEHFRFLEALKLYGKEWKRVQEHVCTRTSTQARSHAQKFFNKLEKRKQSLTDFLETLDLNDMEKHYIMSDLDDEKVNHAYIGKNKAHPKRKLNET
jgi:SHAQKYF class myb-like DNA-binding protein